jgi:hypothetical protein
MQFFQLLIFFSFDNRISSSHSEQCWETDDSWHFFLSNFIFIFDDKCWSLNKFFVIFGPLSRRYITFFLGRYRGDILHFLGAPLSRDQHAKVSHRHCRTKNYVFLLKITTYTQKNLLLIKRWKWTITLR